MLFFFCVSRKCKMLNNALLITRYNCCEILTGGECENDWKGEGDLLR